MSKASAQVVSKESAGMPLMHSSDVYDPDDAGDENRVLDMMKTGLSAPQLLRHMEVISSREFPYEDLITRHVDGTETVMAGRSLAMEAFMEQGVVIEIAESTDEKASPTVYVAVNGDSRWLPRGIPVRIPRKHVERLAQSSERSFKTPVQNSAGAEEGDNERPAKVKNTQAYPFAVINDSCPDKALARRWLARVTRQST